MHETDHSDRAAQQIRRTALAKDMAALANKPVPHVGNGSTLKATTVLAMLNWRDVKLLYARPCVSEDGPLLSWRYAQASIDGSFRSTASPTSTQHAPAQPVSCSGTTSSTATAASATSRPHSCVFRRRRPLVPVPRYQYAVDDHCREFAVCEVLESAGSNRPGTDDQPQPQPPASCSEAEVAHSAGNQSSDTLIRAAKLMPYHSCGDRLLMPLPGQGSRTVASLTSPRPNWSLM